MNEEEKIKRLEDENYRLLEVLRLTREGVGGLDQKGKETKAMADAARAQAKILEQKCAAQEIEIARLGKVQAQAEKALSDAESVHVADLSEKERLENEKLSLSKDLEVKAAEESRLLDKIQGLEAEYAQKEAKIKVSLQEAGGTLEKQNARVLELENELQSANKRSKALQSEKDRLEEESQVALKLDAKKTTSLAALEEIRERLASDKERLESEIETKSEETVSLKGEIRQLAKISEQRQDQVRGLEAEYAQKEAALKASLQEAGGTLEKQNSRILGLEDELQSANKHSRALQFVKKKLEEDQQAAMKLDAEKTAALTALEEIKEHLGNELETKSEETVSLKDEIRQLTEISEQRQDQIRSLENEKLNLGKDLEAQGAEEVRLSGKIRGLEAEYAQKEAALKASEAAMAQQAERHRLAIEAREEAATQQAAKHRLAIGEHEAKHRAAEEAKRSLEAGKKALAAELAGKVAEESSLRVSLQEAGGTLEKQNARILGLEDELQSANKHSRALQFVKKKLEEDQQAAMKLDAEKTASLTALEEIRERLESEKERLENEIETKSEETVSLKDEIRQWAEISEQRQDQIRALEDEKLNLSKDLEAQGAEEVRLSGKIRGLEAEYAQKESALKASEAAMAQQAEKHRLTLKANEEVVEQQAARHRLVIGEHEAKHRTAEEAKRSLEAGKKALAAELAGKVAEESSLRVSLQEAGGTLEKQNARILGLEDELQNAKKHSRALQFVKKQLEEDKQAALKLDADKTAALAALEGIKERLESEKKQLEGEKRSFGKDLEAQAAEKARLLERIQGLEGKYAQKEIEIKAGEAAAAQQAEKHLCAIEASEAAAAKQAEKLRLAIKEFEAKHRTAEETKRSLEGEKKALAAELAGKMAEEARLRAGLQEAGGTLEKLNLRVLELKEELQNANKYSKALESEKVRLEEERQAALKLDAQKTASLAALEEIKECLESDKKRLEDEKRIFSKDLEAQVAEETRLLERIQGLEARYAQKEAAIEASEAVAAQLAEKHRLAIKEYEARYRTAEEARRSLEGRKKALASELAGKAAEESRLRASLQEAGGTVEKLNLRVLELKEGLQNANKHSKTLESGKERLEEEKQAAQKLDAEKTAALAALEEIKGRLESDKKRLENEKRNFGRELEAQASEKARLLERIQGLEARYAQREAATEASEAALEQQVEKYRLVIKEYEARYRTAEEARRILEGEKKILVSELAGKAAEESRLRAGLQEAGGTLEKLNARVPELKEELQNANRRSKALQSEKERVEEEKQAALKLNEEKIVVITALEEIREHLENEKKRLEGEKRSLGKDLEAQASEKVRLLERILELETRYAQKEAAIKESEAAMGQQAEKRRVAIKEYEARQQMAEEARRILEGEKKALASEFAGKAAEESRLRAGLREAGGTLEKLNLRVLELKEELQNANRHFKALESERERLEEEKQAALKVNEQKSAVIAALENDKRISESEKQRLGAEKKNLEGERLRFEKALEDRSAQANAQSERLTKRCAELDGMKNQAKNELDKKARTVESLTEMGKKMEALLEERGAAQSALEEELKRERETRAQVESHSKYLEATLVDLEKKINTLL